MLEIDGKQYRNLEEQVGYLTEAFHTGKLIDELGIKVLGVYETLDEAKQATPGPYDYGEAFQIGSSAPYDLYIFTRNVGADGEADFFNFGSFPAPGPQGEQGIQGEKGADGKDGERGERGAQGLQGYKGDKGDTGATGPIGPQGPKGDKGDVGPSMNIAGTLTSTSQLPTPTKELQEKGTVYIIPNESGVNHMWAIQGETSFMWIDIGISGVQGPQGPSGKDGAGVNTTSDVKLDLGDTTVSYDTTDGIVINSTMRVTFNNGETHDCPVRYSIPIKGVNGMAFDKAADAEEIKAGLSETSTPTVSTIKASAKPTLSNEITVTGLGIKVDAGSSSTVYTFPANSNTTDSFVAKSQLPTLFGNKSLTAGGNIDIYKHKIRINSSDNVSIFLRAEIYSSSNLVVDSLTDLKTLTNNDTAILVNGKVKVGSIFFTPMWVSSTGGTVSYCDTNGSSGTSSVSITSCTIKDTVTTI